MIKAEQLLKQLQSQNELIAKLKSERDSARYHLKIFAHAFKTDNCPPSISIAFADSIPVNVSDN